MKKIIAAAFLIFTGAFIFAKDSMLNAGKEVAAKVLEKIDLSYISMGVQVDEELADILEEMAEESKSPELEGVYELKLHEDKFLEACAGLSLTRSSKELYRQAVISQLFVQIQRGSYGMMGYTMFSIIADSDVFVATDENPSDTIYLYCYKNIDPIMISFKTGKDNAVYAYGQMLFGLSMDEVEAVDFNGIYTIEEISEE